MKNKLIKVLIFMIITMLLFGSINVFALDPNEYDPMSPGTDGNYVFIYRMGQILSVINTIGVVCSVIIISAIGIKYMLGSVEEKAEYKKTMLAYLIGALLVFSSTTIPNIIYKILD